MSIFRRLVFDTSTLVSAALRVGSLPHRAMTHALSVGELCVCASTLAELDEVLMRAKFDRYQSAEVRRAATLRIKEMIDLVARQFPDWGQPAAHERALVTVSTMVGTLILARAVDDAALAEALCGSTLKKLSSVGG